MESIAFPCREVPHDKHVARLVGLYPQRDGERFMQRTKILGGALDADAWRGLAEAARRHTPGTPLHLTTRQDIEFHDVAPSEVPGLQRAIAEADLTSLGACGDTLRNIAVDPCCGARQGLPKLQPLAWDVRRLLEATDGILDLPRKFKISLSACGDGCGQPYIHDLGFVGRRRDGQWGFQVMGGGSLGSRPATGILLWDWLPPEDVQPLVLAAVRFFAAEGNRKNRRRARLRHVRERIGDEAFRSALASGLAEARKEREWAASDLSEPEDGLEARFVLTFANGNVSPEAAEALADLAARADLRVRIAPHHRVFVYGKDETALRQAVSELAPLRAAAALQPSVVACPGTRWCSRALADTNGLADRIRERLSGTAAGLTICVSGCPNGCAHSAVADVGLTGAVATRGGRRQEVYNLLAGGGMGRDARLAELVARKLTAEEAVEGVADQAGSLSRD